MDMIFLNRIKAVNIKAKCDKQERRSSRVLRRFTDTETDFLIETEGDYTAEELGKKMGFQTGSIRDKAHRMGLKLKSGWAK